MKKALFSFLFLLFIVLAGAVVAPSFIDWNSYKPEITKAARDAIGRDLKISGDISVTILPEPKVTVSGIALANITGGSKADFVTVKKVEVNVAFMPLLSGQVKINSVYLQEPNVVLEKLADGRANWVFAKGEDAQTNTGSPAATDNPAVDFSLERLEIRGAHLTYIDASSGTREELRDLNTVASLKSLTGPFLSGGEVSYKGIRLGFDVEVGKLRDNSPLPLSIGLRLPKVAGTSVRLAGRVQGLRQAPKIIASLQVAIKQPELLALRFGMNDLPDLAKEAVSINADVSASAEKAQIEKLEMQFGRLKLSGSVHADLAEQPIVSANIAARNINLDEILSSLTKTDAKKPVKTGAKSTHATPKQEFQWPTLPVGIIGKVSLNVDGLTYRERLIRQGRLTAELKDGKLTLSRLAALLPGGSDFSASAQYDPASAKEKLKGRIEFGSNNLRGLLSWVGIKIAAPPGRVNNLVLTADLASTDKLLRITNLQTRLDNSNINGSGVFRLQRHPSFGANLRIDRLNISNYLPPTSTGKSTASSTAKPGATPNLKEIFAPLNRFNADMRLKVGQLIVEGNRLNDIDLDAKLVNGTATIKRANVGSIAGGSLAVAGKLRVRGSGTVDLNVNYSAKSLQGLAKTFSLSLPFNPARLTKVVADVDLKGDFERLKTSARFGAADIAVTSSGMITQLLQQPRMDMTASMKHPSLERLSRMFNLGVKPLRGADAPIEVVAKLKGDLGLMTTDLKLKLARGETSLLGEISGLTGTPSYNLSLSTRHEDVVKLLRGIGVPAKRVRRAKQILLLAKVNGTAKKFNITNLQGTVGEMNLQGEVTGLMRKSRPYVQARLRADKLLLDPYVAAVTEGKTKKKKAQRSGPRWSKEFIDLSALRLLDADIKVQADRIQWRALRLVDSNADIQLKDGIANLKVTSSSAKGGTIQAKGQLRAPASSKQLAAASFNFSGNKIHLREVLLAFGGIRRFSGLATLQGNISTTGNNQWSMVRALNGKVSFKAENGAIEGVDLKRATEILANPVNVFALVRSLGGAFSEGRTEFITLQGDYLVKKGIATTNNLNALFKFAEAKTNGRVDLPRWSLNKRAVLTFKGIVKPLPLPVTVKGPMDNPKVEFSEKALGNFVGNAVIGVGTAPITIMKETGNVLNRLFGGSKEKDK